MQRSDINEYKFPELIEYRISLPECPKQTFKSPEPEVAEKFFANLTPCGNLRYIVVNQKSKTQQLTVQEVAKNAVKKADRMNIRRSGLPFKREIKEEVQKELLSEIRISQVAEQAIVELRGSVYFSDLLPLATTVYGIIKSSNDLVDKDKETRMKICAQVMQCVLIKKFGSLDGKLGISLIKNVNFTVQVAFDNAAKPAVFQEKRSICQDICIIS